MTDTPDKPDYSQFDQNTRLFHLLVDEFERVLTEGQTVVAGDEVVKVAPKASTLNVIRQFLKDALPKSSNPPSLRDLLSNAEERSEVALPFPTPKKAPH